MKKTVFLVFFVILLGLLISCSDNSAVEPTKEVGKGTAPVDSKTSGGRSSCGWVQLWEGGPKFALFNVGSTIDSFASVTTAGTTQIGGLYCWGGKQDARTSYTDDHSTSTSDIQGSANDTAKNLWGSNWKMPTKEDLCKLVNMESDGETPLAKAFTTWTWCDGNSTQYESGCTLTGYKVTGTGDYSGNSIFLPAGGYYDGNKDKTISRNGTMGGIYSSILGKENSSVILVFDSNEKGFSRAYLEDGYSVRPILAE